VVVKGKYGWVTIVEIKPDGKRKVIVDRALPKPRLLGPKKRKK
jgi:hypothetical protein